MTLKRRGRPPKEPVILNQEEVEKKIEEVTQPVIPRPQKPVVSKPRKATIVLVTSFPHVHPTSRVRFVPYSPIEHEIDPWVQRMIDAKCFEIQE